MEVFLFGGEGGSSGFDMLLNNSTVQLIHCISIPYSCIYIPVKNVIWHYPK